MRGFHPDTLDSLNRYRWPGNVRELENAIERVVSLSHGPLLTPDDLPAAIRQAPSPAEQKSTFPTRRVRLSNPRGSGETPFGARAQGNQGEQSEGGKILGIDRRTSLSHGRTVGLIWDPTPKEATRTQGSVTECGVRF